MSGGQCLEGRPTPPHLFCQVDKFFGQSIVGLAGLPLVWASYRGAEHDGQFTPRLNLCGNSPSRTSVNGFVHFRQLSTHGNWSFATYFS